MEQMSEGEILTFLASAVCAAWWWGRWHWDLVVVSPLRPAGAPLVVLGLAPWIGAGLTLLVLRRWASFDVRDSGLYMTFYMVLGAAWVAFLARIIVPRLGVSARDDGLERRNPAAALAVGGAIVGTSLCYAGGNIGDGPGWWVVVFCAVLSTGSFLLCWLLVEKLGGLSETLTVERDTSAGLRAAGLFVGLGLVLGRSVAGDWVSAAATVRDFLVHGWPALPVGLLAAAIERTLRPTAAAPARHAVIFGLVPGLLYAVAGAVAVVERGPW